MARISMRNVQKSSVSEYFDLYLSSAAARGVKDKTLQTYKNHFRSIAKRMDVTVPMNRLNSQDLEDMILSMREEGLSASSINSYTRTLKVFFSWCNEEGHSNLNIKLYKAPETVKEVSLMGVYFVFVTFVYGKARSAYRAAGFDICM